MAQMNAGQAVIEMLRAEGVDHIFGICGTTTNNIVTELHGRSDIRFVDTRHEQNAAFMAYGYARASGGAGVIIAGQNGPGATNLVTGLAQAHAAFSPVVALAGGGRAGIAAGDHVAAARPQPVRQQPPPPRCGNQRTVERGQGALGMALGRQLQGFVAVGRHHFIDAGLAAAGRQGAGEEHLVAMLQHESQARPHC